MAATEFLNVVKLNSREQQQLFDVNLSPLQRESFNLSVNGTALLFRQILPTGRHSIVQTCAGFEEEVRCIHHTLMSR
jgi:hypothetical protein